MSKNNWLLALIESKGGYLNEGEVRANLGVDQAALETMLRDFDILAVDDFVGDRAYPLFQFTESRDGIHPDVAKVLRYIHNNHDWDSPQTVRYLLTKIAPLSPFSKCPYELILEGNYLQVMDFADDFAC